MVPSLPQLAPRTMPLTGQLETEGPPVNETFFNSPPELKPTQYTL